jgi:hypothetical protein
LGLLSVAFYASNISADLYETEVAVSGQDQTERERAIKEALSITLVKVTGQRQRHNSLDFRAIQEEATSYVQSFSYRNGSNGGQQQVFLQVRFDEAAIKRVLRKKNIGIWDAKRPETILWLAQEENGKRTVLREGSGHPLAQEIESVFQARALPFIMPLMDVEDGLSISDIDVWGLFSDRIRQASSRYGTNVQLAGRLSLKKGIYTGRIMLLFRGQRYDLVIAGLTLREVAVEIADLVGNTLASFYAVRSSQQGSTPALVVEGVDSISDYADVLSYLNGFTAVRDVVVTQVSGSTVRLQLTIDGTLKQLADAFSLDRKLELADEDEMTQLLIFRWSGQ